MHKSATKCNETLGKWCKNKHGASKIIDTFETYQREVTKSSRPLFCLRAGARTISMVATTRVGVDHFWLTGARDEGGSWDTTNSGVRLGPGRTVL
jgi:hypothetical protein